MELVVVVWWCSKNRADKIAVLEKDICFTGMGYCKCKRWLFEESSVPLTVRCMRLFWCLSKSTAGYTLYMLVHTYLRREGTFTRTSI